MKGFLSSLLVLTICSFSLPSSAQLKAPTSLTSSVNLSGFLQLDWSEVDPPASGYNIYRDGLLIKTIQGHTITTYVDSNAVAGQTIKYCVSSIEGSTESQFKNCILTSGFQPGGIVASDNTGGDSVINLSWSIGGNCLLTPMQNDIYLEIHNNTTGKDVHTEILRYADLTTVQDVSTSLRLDNQNHLLLDSNYNGGSSLVELTQLGRSLDVYGDYAVIGAPGADDDTGAVFIYRKTAGQWLLDTTLRPDAPVVSDTFGYAVAIYKNKIIVGSPAPGSNGKAYIFEKTGGIWFQKKILTSSQPQNNDGYGRSVSIDSFTALVGSPLWSNNRGAMFFYLEYSGTWYTMTRLQSPTPQDGERFATSLKQEGGFMVVGGPGYNSNQGKAYIWKRSAFAWSLTATLIPNSPALSGDLFGASVSLHNQRAVVGSPGYDGGKGRVVLFERTGMDSNWPDNASFNPTGIQSGNGFGSTVDVYGDWVAGTAPNTSPAYGTVYLFHKNGSSWTPETQVISRSAGQASDLFGSALAIDGDDLLIGSPFENGNQGTVYTYLRSGSTWVTNGSQGALKDKSLTVEFWINRQGAQGINGPLLVNDEVGLFMTSAVKDQLNYTAGGSPVYFNYQLPQEKWTHIAVVVDSVSSTTQLYVNGELTDELPVYISLVPQRFGKTQIGGVTHYLNALVKDIRFWTIARNANEIRSNYDQELTGSELGLTGYWKLDEGSGDTITDASGNYHPAEFKPTPPVIWNNDTSLAAATQTGDLKHFVGAAKNYEYQMTAYAMGFGSPVCTYSDSGSTIPYIQPVIAVDTSRPDSVKFTWTNDSRAVSFYRIFRNGDLLGTIDSSAESYVDVYRYRDSTSLKNGEEYRYCFLPFSTRYLTNGESTYYDSLFVYGATHALDFTATNNAYPDKVEMSWRPIDAYSDALIITRDGSFFAQLDSNVTSYVDNNPIYGKQHRYELKVMNDGNLVVADSDIGSIESVGVIAGRVVSKSGNYALSGLTVRIIGAVGGDTIIRTQQTGLTGDFRFDQVYFGTSTSYQVSVDSIPEFAILTYPKTVPLSLSNYEVYDLLFYGDKEIKPVGSQSLTLSGFQSVPVPGQDRVMLSWNYTSSDTTWFKIFRNNQLISILTDTNTTNTTSYYDPDVIPNTKPGYKVVAYVYDNDTVVTEASSIDTAILGNLAPVAFLSDSADDVSGIVYLNWTHTSTNIDGFELWRNDLPIAEIPVGGPGEQYSYEDLEGEPGASYTYSIKVFATKMDSVHYSDTTRATPSPIVYPELPEPSKLDVLANSADETVKISWEYPQQGNRNFYGFDIRRIDQLTQDTVSIAFIHQNCYNTTVASHYQYEHIDRQGVPMRNYTYQVLSVKLKPLYYTDPQSAAVQFPSIQAVDTFSASDDTYHSWISMVWEDDCANHDGYLIKRNGTDLAWLPRSSMSYIDGLVAQQSSIMHSYEIFPYRVVDDSTYVGGVGVLDNGSIPGTGPISPTVIVPQNFEASDHYSGHIQLSWAYPVYAFSEFFIYRDGTLMDSLDNSLRYWYDTSAVEGVTYVYSMRAKYMDIWSRYTSDPGTLRPKMQIEGVAQSDGGFGIPDVLIEVSIGGQVLYHTYTDSTGFYRIPGMTKQLGATATVMASGPNAAFIDTSQDITIQDTVDRYQVDFIDTTYQKVVPIGQDIAEITNFIATIDPLTNKVNLSWNLSSTNFSGIRLYREFGEVANVTYDQPKFFLDEVAAPGYNYQYGIQAYWVLPTGTLKSDSVYVAISVPDLAPVLALQALPDRQEDLVNLHWSHPTDNHSYYEVRRNGDLLGIVPTGTRMSFADTTGLPGRNYRYRVTCYEVGPSGSFSSQPNVVYATYPQVALPVELMLDTVQADNHVTIAWSHTSDFYDYATIYRYTKINPDPIPIDTVYKGELKSSIDYWGSPLDTNWYQVTATVEKNGIFYESDPTTEWIIFPPIKTPGLPMLTVGADKISISGSYLPPFDGYTGFKFLRDGEELSRKSGLSTTYGFTDTDAEPGQTYTYGITVFKEADSIYHSDTVTLSATFPILSAPVNCVATDGNYFNHVVVTWQYQSDANSGFIIYRDGNPFDTLGSISGLDKSGAGIRKYIDIINGNDGGPTEHSYQVRAFKYKNGNLYLSSLSNVDDGWAGIQRFNTVSSTAGTPDSRLGYSVAMEKEYAVAGAPGSDSAQVFDYISDSYVPGSTLIPDTTSGTAPDFGYAISTTPSGFAISAPFGWESANNAGEVYLYDRNNGNNSLNTIIRNTDFIQQSSFIPIAQGISDTITVEENAINHGDTSEYTRLVISDIFQITGMQETTNLDIRLENISINLSKASDQEIWIESVVLEKIGGPSIVLFSTNSDPANCPQDTIVADFARTGGVGPLSSSGSCGTFVSGVFSPLDDLDASYNSLGISPNGDYRITYRVKLIDPDVGQQNILTSYIEINSVNMQFVTLPNGIHTPQGYNNYQFGTSVGYTGTIVAGGAPNGHNTSGSSGPYGLVKLYDLVDSTWIEKGVPGNRLRCGYYTVELERVTLADHEHILDWKIGTKKLDIGSLQYEIDPAIYEGSFDARFNERMDTTVGYLEYPQSFYLDMPGTHTEPVIKYTVYSGEETQDAWTGQVDPKAGRVVFDMGCSPKDAHMGQTLALSADQLIVGLPTADKPRRNAGLVWYYKLDNNGNWTFQQEIEIDKYTGEDGFGLSLALDGNYLAIGSDSREANRDKAGAVSIYRYNSGSDEFRLINDGIIHNPDGPKKDRERFGYAVAIKDNFMAIGAPNVDSGSVESAGAVYLYEKDENDNWSFNKRYFAPDAQADAAFGSSVALAGNTLMVGAPGHDEGGSNSGKVYFFYVRDQIDTVIASDGTELNKTRVSWEYEGSLNSILGFNVYRDSSLIATADPNRTFIFDSDGIPGRKYVYQVRVVSLDGVEGLPKGDIGWSPPNGILDGTVLTLTGNNPVRGVRIEAWANVDGEVYRYSDTTDTDGKIKIRRVYYNDSARYYAQAILTGHEFDPDTQSVELNLQQNTIGLAPFFDLTAFVVRGRVEYKNECPVDSVTIRQITIYKDGREDSEDTETDLNGYYSFNISPWDSEIRRYEYEIDSTRITIGATNDTTYYRFSSGPPPLTDLLTLDRETLLDPFVETTTYPVKISIRTECGPIDYPNQHRWKILVRSLNSCYESEIVTDGFGEDSINVPPGDYYLRVLDADNRNTTILTALDYLKVRPRKLNLMEFHQSLKGAKSDTVVQFDFIYHVVPRITMPDLSGFLCGDPNKPVVVESGETYTFSINVAEWFGQFCPVTEGFLVIRNDAARTNPITINYDPDPYTPDFEPYIFTAGSPNPVSPHLKWMFVEYHTKTDGFIGELAVAFIVTGKAPVPGSDIFVNPNSSDDGDLLMPLFVLRDPPGDGSYSTIDSGATMTGKLSVTTQNDLTPGVTINGVKKAFGIGVTIDVETSLGGGATENDEYEVTMQTTKSFSTSSTSAVDNATNTDWLTGNSADVLVGAGLALDYSIMRSITVSDDTCAAFSQRVYSTGAEIKTTWIYSIDQIRNLVRNYLEDSTRAANGLLSFSGQDQDSTIEFLTIRKRNWEQMLEYHAKQTLPHYQLCDPKSLENIPKIWRDEAKEWLREGFCDVIGTYSTRNGKEVFELKPDSMYEWNTDLLDRYNKVKQVLREFPYDEDHGLIPRYSTTALANVKLDQAYSNAYGPDAKNVTFSGGTSYTESRAVSKSRGSSYTQTVHMDNKIGLGKASEAEKTFYSGTYTGGPTGGNVTFWNQLKPLKSNYKVSEFVSHSFSYNDVESHGNTTNQSVSYTLSDDDPGDQYSVTVLNGVNPNHTPFFALKGGRTSCPSEPGAISRDQCQIAVLDPLGGRPPSKTQYNLDPSKPVRFPLQLANQNQFGEGRWYEVYVRENTNLNGATVKLGGTVIHQGGAIGTGGAVPVFIPADESVYANLYIEKGPFFYDYEGLQIAMRPVCDPYIVESITLNLHFRHPCSDISIIAPANGWVVNNASSDLDIYLGDYDPYNPELQRVQLMYRRKGVATSNIEWDTILSITADSLRGVYERELTYIYPTYKWLWNVPNTLTDGEYELMALAYCGTSGIVESNRVPGTISRNRFEVLGLPNPSDGLLSLGDEISVTFNRQIDCPKSMAGLEATFTLDSLTGTLLDVGYGCIGNKIVFVIDTPSNYEGRMVYASLDGVYDINGNQQYEPVEWAFEISNNPVYWHPRSLEVTVERGTEKTIHAALYNTGAGSEAYTLSTTNAWLTPTVGTGVVQPIGEMVELTIDARNLAIGDYQDIVVADIAGFNEEALPVTVHVIKPILTRKLDPAKYQHQLSVIARPRIDNVKSNDTMDVITAWIDGEFRGSGRLRQVGANYHASYITVHGDSADLDKVVDFRVWDASVGAEYQGHPDETVTFTADNNVYGSTPDPILIDVDSDKDSMRYIPLRAGWNWLSLNSVMDDMSVSSVFKSLSLDHKDVIMYPLPNGNYVSAQYVDTLGSTYWDVSMGLSTIDTQSGYLLYLRHADTLHISGRDVQGGTIGLLQGWNLIGYTPQRPWPIDVAFNMNGVSPAFTDSVIIKSQTEFSIYNQIDERWEGSLTKLQPYNAYKVYSEITRNVNYRGGSSDHWEVDPTAFEHAMRVIASIQINGFEFRDENSKIAAFIDGECRGVGTLQYIEELNKYRGQVMIYSNNPGKEVTFKFWDSYEDSVYQAVQTLSYNPEALVGDLVESFVVSPNFVSSGTDIQQPQMQSTFEVFPNPFRHELMLTIDEHQGADYTVTMHNSMGQQVLEKQVTTVNGPNRVYLQGAHLASGMYQITIRKDDEIIETMKVIRQ